MNDVERLLRTALVPVEPPEALSDRLARGLTELTEAAAHELEQWELSSMRDPRNWARPAAAVMVGTVAGGALVVVRARQRQRRRHSGRLRALERAVQDAAGDLQRRLGR